jgi:transposase
MSRKKRTHLRGERGQAFTDKIRGIPLDRILCVSLDIHKYFHVVMIHNALGEIVTATFEIDIFRMGFDQLCQAVKEAATRTQAQVILLGMEPSSHYFENLARHLLAWQPVTLINSYAVKQNRTQQLMQREKDDEIDTAAIGDLLRRGEGTPYRPASGVYLELQQLDRVRLGKVKIRTMLQNQILGHLDRIFPGLVIIGEEARARYKPLFTTNFWKCQTLQHLIRVCPDPHQLVSMTPPDLVKAFHAQHYALGRPTAAKLIAYAHKILLPEAALSAIRCELLRHDLALLEEVEQHIAELEERLRALLAQTPYQVLAKLKGLDVIQVASLAAAMGDPAHYQYGAQVFRRAGLVCGRDDSGIRQRKGKGKHITKVGDVYLRRALLSAVFTLLLHQPTLRAYYRKLKKSKPAGVALVATARRATGILWATLRDQCPITLILKRGVTM